MNEEELKDFRFLQDNSFCSNCLEKRALSNIQIIRLNNLNDIEVEGTCPVCGRKMRRYMEFGEDKTFSEKADLFRKQIQ